MKEKRNVYKSLYEKIFFESAARGDKKGAYFPLEPDFILGHDPLIAMIVDDFNALGKKIDKNIAGKCFFTADHFAPPSTVERANILKKFLDFSRELNIETSLFEGICHQLTVEHTRAKPFSFIAGSDSHTTMAGALGAFAAGYGSMDILSALTAGVIYEKPDEAVKVEFTEEAPEYINGRDISLEMIRIIGQSGAIGKVLEFHDNTFKKMNMDDRFTLSNAAVECGATAGIFVPDAVLARYIAARDGEKTKDVTKRFDEYIQDIEFSYKSTVVIETGGLKSKIALPHDFSKVIDVEDIGRGIELDQVFIGSCACGRLSDFTLMCKTLDAIERKNKGKSVKKNSKVKLIITPASQKQYMAAIDKNYVKRLIEFGAVFTNPACGPCGGIGNGILADGENCLSTSTRNFMGRMGSMTSKIYISSAAAAITSAFTGKITPPEEFFR